MCGIAGVYSIDPLQHVAPHLVQAMCNSIVHRGPDSEGIHVDTGFGMGMRRLSIIDLSTGHQPIFTEDRQVSVVCNGEIYNFQELRRSLEQKGHVFSTGSDVEVMVHLYEDHGTDFTRYLNGMFAGAIWDSRARRLILVRDRLGVKPLYYAETGRQLVFGSEIKCLLQNSDISRDLDHQAIYNYFTLGYIPAPRSVFRPLRNYRPPAFLLPKAAALAWSSIGICPKASIPQWTAAPRSSNFENYSKTPFACG
jgi:asparagine synthase (glutamine-hydrolysing)